MFKVNFFIILSEATTLYGRPELLRVESEYLSTELRPTTPNSTTGICTTGHGHSGRPSAFTSPFSPVPLLPTLISFYGFNSGHPSAVHEMGRWMSMAAPFCVAL